MLACHVNILCGRLACFKKGLNRFATLAVGLEQLAELGGEASETPPAVSLRNATPASLINYCRAPATSKATETDGRRMGMDLARQEV